MICIMRKTRTYRTNKNQSRVGDNNLIFTPICYIMKKARKRARCKSFIVQGASLSTHKVQT